MAHVIGFETHADATVMAFVANCFHFAHSFGVDIYVLAVVVAAEQKQALNSLERERTASEVQMERLKPKENRLPLRWTGTNFHPRFL